MMLGSINANLYTTMVTADREAIPSDLTPEARQRLRSLMVHRLANSAQRLAYELRQLERGAAPDDACLAFEELEALARESFPWLRAARGERGAR